MIYAALVFLVISIFLWIITIALSSGGKGTRTFTNATVIGFTKNRSTINLLVRFAKDGAFIVCETNIVDKKDFKEGDVVKISYRDKDLGSKVKYSTNPELYNGRVWLAEPKNLEQTQKSDHAVKTGFVVFSSVTTLVTVILFVIGFMV